MNNNRDPENLGSNREHPDKQALNRASKLIKAIVSDDMAPEIREKLNNWFRSDLSTAAKYDVLCELFEELKPNLNPDKHEYRKYEQISNLLGFPVEKKHSLRRSLAVRTMRVAAVLLPLLIVGGIAFTWLGRQEKFPQTNVTVAASAFGQKQITLPDGSRVWVNSSGSVAYNDDFSIERFASLSGEAYFSIAKDASKPFRVKVDDLVITVLGTEFSIKTYPDNTIAEVVLVSGSIEAKAKGGKPHIMKPYEQLIYDGTTESMVIKKLQAHEIYDWRVDNLDCMNIPVYDALHRVGIYFDKEVVIDSAVPNNVMIYFKGDSNDSVTAEQAIQIISNISSGFEHSITDNRIVVTPHKNENN